MDGFYPQLRSYYRNVTPLFQKPKLAAYTMLILSFFTIAIFGMFAIRPTLATIANLRKKIEDQKLVLARMQDKITQLRLAEVEYERIKPELDTIFASLPQTPATAPLLGKLNRLLIENKMNVTILQFSPIPLTPPKTSSPSARMIGFTLSGKASYENTLAFIDLLSRIDRIISIDSVDISTDGQNLEGDVLSIAIKGKSYLLWDLPAGKAGKGNNGE